MGMQCALTCILCMLCIQLLQPCTALLYSHASATTRMPSLRMLFRSISPRAFPARTVNMIITVGVKCIPLLCAPLHTMSPHAVSRHPVLLLPASQAMGVPTLHPSPRFDATAFALHYPQRPLISSSIVEHGVGLADFPNGQNAIVAVMAAGYNQASGEPLTRRPYSER